MKSPIMVSWMSYSGGGKDTQAMLLKKFLEKRDGEGSVLVVSAGDIMRALIKQDTYAGRVLDQKVMKEGLFAPAFLATWAWANQLMQELRDGQHVVFPSSPRTLQEAHDLDDFAEFFGLRYFPIYLEVARAEASRRLMARGRKDDKPKEIGNRLDSFERQVLPAVEHYRSESKNGLVVVDGNSSDQAQIHERVLRALKLE